MKQLLKTAGMLALWASVAMAQLTIPGGSVTTNGSYNPVNSMWGVEVVIYGIFGAVICIALLYHCMQGALGSHDGFAKVINVLKYGAFGFGGIYLITHLVSGSNAPI